MVNFFAQKAGQHKAGIYIGSVVLPFVIVLLGLAVRGALPFGSGSLLAIDAWGQYYPMLRGMKDAIQSGELFWSSKGLLGFNLWAQNAYYTGSILWLPLYLLPDRLMIAGINILSAVRIGLAGLTCCVHLLGRTPDDAGESKNIDADIAVLVFSTAYSLSAYMLAFINQFMWIDAVICLPLVVKGIDEIRSRRGGILYIVSLSYTIISNFYIGYMVCLFCVIYFIGYTISVKMPLRQLAERTWSFFTFSLISGAVSAVYTLPAYYAIKNTAASEAGSGGKVEFYHSMAEVLSGFLPFRDISLVYEAPNIYCGLICIVLCILSFIIQKNVRKRLCFILGCVFFYMSLNCNLLDYIWHGFHYPNQLPGRWSFCVCFLVVRQAYSVYLDLKRRLKTNDKEMVIMGRKAGNTRKRRHKYSSLLSAVVIFLFVEVAANAIYTFSCQIRMIDGEAYYRTMAEYEKSAEKIRENDSFQFYRVELDTPWNFNPGQLCGYNGISYYSSTMSKDAYDFFKNIGMSVYAENLSTRYEKSPAADAFLGVKYRIVDTENGAAYVKNETALPICFTVKTGSLDALTGLLSNPDADHDTVKNFIDNNILGRMSTTESSSISGKCHIFGRNEYISGEITTDQGILLATLPYNEGWELYIDGTLQPTYPVAGYLTAANIPQGHHHLELKHKTKGLTAGMLITLSGLAIALAYTCKTHRL